MSDLDLDAIRARVDATTEGPWVSATNNSRKDGVALVGRVADRGTGRAIGVLAGTNGNRHKDAEFIAHAREDIPALLAEVERLKANQPDGGEWEYGVRYTGGDLAWDEWPTGKWTLDYAHVMTNRWPGATGIVICRRVSRGPAQSLSDVLATPDPDSATQTTPRPA